jgi:hypothetical protein
MISANTLQECINGSYVRLNAQSLQQGKGTK